MSLWSWLTRPRAETFQPLCGHIAIYCGKVLQDKGFEVRIAVGDRSGTPHAQAQRRKGDQWQWLDSAGSLPTVVDKDPRFTPTAYYPLENFWLMWEAKWK